MCPICIVPWSGVVEAFYCHLGPNAIRVVRKIIEKNTTISSDFNVTYYTTSVR